MAKGKISRKKRLLVLFYSSLALIFILILRLGQIMFVQAEELEELAQDQWMQEQDISSNRGDILDVNGEILAQSGTVKSVLLKPHDISEPEALAKTLAEILNMDEETVYSAATANRTEVWLKRQISSEEEEKILEAELTKNGVSFFIDTKRYYPYGAFLSQVLGYTTVDQEGQEGIEKQFDKYLVGYNGTELSLIDAQQNTIIGSEKIYIKPQDGYNVTLTIDAVIQSFAETAAKEAYEINEASKVVAIVMDPDTSEIRAMVNYPEADLNNLPRNDLSELNALSRNTAIVDAYEPGSTFKIITTASALDSGAATLESTYQCDGYKLVDGEKIKCWRSGNPHGTQNLTQAVEHSCNPAFMQMALDMGKETFYDYIYRFGFGQKTGIDYSTDASGIVRDIKNVKNVDLARIGFGQSIAVTPLQLCNAVCAVVNGGVLRTPRLVKSLTDSEGTVVTDYSEEEGTQVISKDTSDKMREILQSVVDNGSGSNAKIDGYSVGGKTGTAQMYEDGKIIKGKVISSFVAFAPVEDPEFTVLFVVYEPQVAVTYGSVVAAPFVKDILEKCLKYKNIPGEDTEEETLITVPSFVGKTADQAEKLAQESQLLVEVYGKGTVVAQSPSENTQVKKGSTIALMTDYSENDIEGVPDLTGKTLSEAALMLYSRGLILKTAEATPNSAVICEQSPKEGEAYREGDTVTVKTKIETELEN